MSKHLYRLHTDFLSLAKQLVKHGYNVSPLYNVVEHFHEQTYDNGTGRLFEHWFSSAQVGNEDDRKFYVRLFCLDPVTHDYSLVSEQTDVTQAEFYNTVFATNYHSVSGMNSYMTFKAYKGVVGVQVAADIVSDKGEVFVEVTGDKHSIVESMLSRMHCVKLLETVDNVSSLTFLRLVSTLEDMLQKA